MINALKENEVKINCKNILGDKILIEVGNQKTILTYDEAEEHYNDLDKVLHDETYQDLEYKYYQMKDKYEEMKSTLKHYMNEDYYAYYYDN